MRLYHHNSHGGVNICHANMKTQIHSDLSARIIPYQKQKEKSIAIAMLLLNPATTYPPGPFPAKYYQRAEA